MGKGPVLKSTGAVKPGDDQPAEQQPDRRLGHRGEAAVDQQLHLGGAGDVEQHRPGIEEAALDLPPPPGDLGDDAVRHALAHLDAPAVGGLGRHNRVGPAVGVEEGIVSLVAVEGSQLIGVLQDALRVEDGVARHVAAGGKCDVDDLLLEHVEGRCWPRCR